MRVRFYFQLQLLKKHVPGLVSAFLAFFIFSLPAAADNTSLRGAEREETRFLDPVTTVLSGAAYAPRKMLDGTLYTAGRTAEVLSDEDLVRKVKDILYIIDDELLWYPIVQYASGFRPAYGAGLYYKKLNWRAHSKAVFHDSNYWSYSFKPSYHTNIGQLEWKNSVLGVVEKKDDLRFYGIGADPRNDHRNQFIASNDYGVYTESRRKLQWESSLYRPGKSLGITYLGYYQRRGFKDNGRGDDDVRDIFDTASIPGFNSPVKQLYNELSVEWDTRSQKGRISPGFRSEVYSGFSAGLGENNANLFRTGFDAAGFIPVIRKNRVLVPRLIADLVENLNDDPIPFSEYPRQNTFRGVSNRDMIRSDRVSIVPSIEYQWPLSHMLAGHLFFDTLFTGPRASSIRWHEGLWAAGAGIDFNYLKKELARIELAIGSEGFQAKVSLGAPLKSNHRKDW